MVIGSLGYIGSVLTKRLIEKNFDIEKFGEFLNSGWQAKKKFASGVTNTKIDKIYTKAIKCGALGGKLTGAGGGGHLLLYCSSKKQKSVISAMVKLGLTKIDYEFYENGPNILNTHEYIKNLS